MLQSKKTAVSGGDFLRINRQLLKIVQQTYSHVGCSIGHWVASWNLRFKPLPYVELPVGLNETEVHHEGRTTFLTFERFWWAGGPGGPIFA